MLLHAYFNAYPMLIRLSVERGHTLRWAIKAFLATGARQHKHGNREKKVMVHPTSVQSFQSFTSLRVFELCSLLIVL
jgi:hypothetical protein